MAADEIYTLPDNPTYHEDIRKLQDSDPASASNTFNPVLQKIVENTHYAKLRADEAAEAAGVAQELTDDIILAMFGRSQTTGRG